MKKIALLTGRDLEEPDVDLVPLKEEISKLGGAAEIVCWEKADLGSYRVSVLRSTWNYVAVRDEFCDFCDAQENLFNPPDIVRWNTDKSYLRDLEGRGVPVVPTAYDGEIPWDDVVVKPRVSAGSFLTERFTEKSRARAFLEQHAARAMMVQPYIHDVDRNGERSVVFIDGSFTHAVRKTARFSGGEERVSEALPIAEDELMIAKRALEPLMSRLLYARVDLVRDGAGRPCVMELELVEPSLFLIQHPPALERFARAIMRRAR